MWEELKILEFAKTTSGGTPSRTKKEYYNRKNLWVKSGELKDNCISNSKEKITDEAIKNSSAKIFPKNTLLIAMYGATVGKTAILKIPATTNQAICGIIPNYNRFNPEYLRNFFIFKKVELLKQRYGGAQPNISQTIIKNTYVSLPPLPEQHKIVYILTTIQKAIEKQEEIIKTTTELKKAMMQKLFTEGLHGEPQKETEIGLVPESWEVVCLSDVTASMNYGTSVKCDYGIKGKAVLRIPNVINGKVDISDLKFGNLKEKESEKLLLQKGDLLFVRTNGVKENAGRCAIFKEEIDDCYFASYLIRLRVIEAITPEFLNYYTTTSAGKKYLSGKSIRTADGKYNINTGILKNVKLPLPNIEEQLEIRKCLDVVDNKIENAVTKRKSLDGLFKSLLNQLMAGQLRVNNIDFPNMELD